MRAVRAQQKEAEKQKTAESSKSAKKQKSYQPDPNKYAAEVLGVKWWAKQQEIARAVVEHSRVFVQASHNVGKTFLTGGLVNWHFDCYAPGITKTTAPNKAQVNRLTWGEVRIQRNGRGMPPTAALIQGYHADGRINPEHYAQGFTARDATSFQGTHAEHLFIIFEEMVGIKQEFWEAADGMTSSGDGNRWLAIGNPTDTTSYAFNQFQSGEWHVIQISALEHPNIMAELEGRPRPFPKAISLKWVNDKLRSWCRKLQPNEKPKPGIDFCWPPLEHCQRKGIEPVWYRPGSIFEGRVLGRWPSTSPDAVWSNAVFRFCCEVKPQVRERSLTRPVEIGCDVARFGDDNTAIHVRQGTCSLHHESVNGYSTTETANRLKALCRQFAPLGRQEYWQVPVKIDDTGVGGGVVDQKDEFFFVPVNAATLPLEPENYKLKRDELWFAAREIAEEGLLDLSFLDKETQDRLERQLLAVKWKPNARGQRVIEEKEKTKARLGFSPDDADAFNLAYCETPETIQAILGGDRDKLLKRNS